MKYTEEVLAPLVESSFSVFEVLRKLGLSSGCSHGKITKLIKQYGLSTTHFKLGMASTSGANKLHWSDVLVYGKKAHTYRLRRAIIESGREHICSTCGLPPHWNGLPLVLQIEHINANDIDNRPENVKFLCPNCHTQTKSYGRTKTVVGRACRICGKRVLNRSLICRKCYGPGQTRNVLVGPGRLKLKRCVVCGKPAVNKYCSPKCSNKGQEKVVWPDNLVDLVEQSSQRAVARLLGVSDKAVAKKLHLRRQPADHKC